MAKKTTQKSDTKRYTEPALRERLKKQITEGDKGGKPGQWSARKAQLLAASYKKQGGGYAAPKAQTQKHLDTWTDEKWSTADGSKARSESKTKRYLPKEAWDALSPAEKRKTNAKKEAGSKAGKQFVANTPKAKQARKKVTEKASGAPRKKGAAKPTPQAQAKKTTKARADKRTTAKAKVKTTKKAARKTVAKRPAQKTKKKTSK